jgi:hypothetical protein
VAARRWSTLSEIFAFLGSRSDLEVIVPQALADRYALTPVVLGRGELLRLAVVLVSRERLLLPDHVLVEDRAYSAAEAFDLLCQALKGYRQAGGLPAQVATSIARGPADGSLEPSRERRDMSLERVVEVAESLPAGCVPDMVEEGMLPSQFLFLMAEAVVALAERRRLGTVPVAATANLSTLAQRFRADWPGQLRKWPIHDPQLNLDDLTRLATLQFWSYRPAGFPW